MTKLLSVNWRIATIRAIAIAVFAFLLAGCLVTVQAALQFNGRCGGVIPFLSAPQPCTLAQHVWDSVSFTFAVFFHEFWWIALLFAGIAFIGSAIFEISRDRKR
jgi:hypothetical protein